jgi:hypothetical protein
MAKQKPKTKKGQQRKIAKVLREAKRGTLRTSAGTKPKSRKQEIAIALSEAGVSKKKRKK